MNKLGLCRTCLIMTCYAITVWEIIVINGTVFRPSIVMMREHMSRNDNWIDFSHAIESQLHAGVIKELRLNDNLVMSRGTGVYADTLIDGNGYCIYHIPESAVRNYG